ncbi:MAG: two-component regulator propeller domain-containing protein, partial [Bacteroidota bacterium]
MKTLIIIVLCMGFAVYGQDPYAVKYSIDEGLPTSNIYSVFQDGKGLMWFGTDVGVLRFDGSRFKHYSTDDGLADNEVFKIYEDSSQRMWFITLNGQLSFYEDGMFVNSNSDSLIAKASRQKMIVDIFESDNKLNVLYRDGWVSQLDYINSSVSKAYVNSPLYGYWAANGDIFYLSIDAITSSKTDGKYPLEHIMNTSLTYRLVYHEGQLLFSVNNKVYEFSDGKAKLLFQLDGSEIIHLGSINNQLWIGTRSGLYIKDDNNELMFFNDDIVSDSLMDSQGNYWVTTLNDGIKFIPNINIVTHKLSESGVKVNAIQNNDDLLWIAAESGLYNLNPRQTNIATRLSSQYIKKVRCYNDLVFGVGNTATYVIDGKDTNILDFGANDFYYDGGFYWFSSSVVFRFLPSNIQEFPLLKFKDSQPSVSLKNRTILSKRTNVILPYKDDNILFGTSTGLYLYDKTNTTQLFAEESALNSSIQDTYFDSQNDLLFVATSSTGVSIIDSKGAIRQVSKKQQLSSNTSYCIKSMGDYVLIGTNKGIDKLSITEDDISVENVNALLGLKDEKINDIEVVDSTIFLATDKGLLSFHEQQIDHQPSKPKLVIDRIYINGERRSNGLEALESNDNNFTIHFSGISYADYGNMIYQYKTDNNSWKSIEGTVLEINNLPSGKHTIALRTKGRAGAWSPIEEIYFKIKTPIWKSAPFVIGLMTLIIGSLYFIVGKRISSLKKAFSKERNQLKAR